MNDATNYDDLMTYKEVAALLRKPIAAIYAMVNKRIVPCVRIGKRTTRFSRSEILDWLKAHHVAAEEGKAVSNG
jgi:excisionase family DNA binding protein